MKILLIEFFILLTFMMFNSNIINVYAFFTEFIIVIILLIIIIIHSNPFIIKLKSNHTIIFFI